MPTIPPPSIASEPPPSDGGDAVEEEHGLGAFAQHGEPDDDQQHRAFAAAVADRVADAARLGGERGAVRGHPQVVPGEHDDGDAEHRGVEELLTHAARHRRDAVGAERDERRAREARGDPAGEPAVAPGIARVAAATMPTMSAASSTSRKTMTAVANMAARARYLATMTPFAVFSLYSPTNG